MVELPVPVLLSIVQEVPHASLLREFLHEGLAIVGGFPLWLVGGAPFYSDIDIYTFNVKQSEFAWDRIVALGGIPLCPTPQTYTFDYQGTVLQLVNRHPNHQSLKDIIYTVDVSPTASALVLNEGDELEVMVLYPNDIKSRVCRVFINHDWTWHRIDNYESKGYRVVYDVWDDQRTEKDAEDSDVFPANSRKQTY